MALPYIEISIASTTEEKLSRIQILAVIQERIERLDKVPAKIQTDDKEPTLIIKYNSVETFLDSYQREFPVFEAFLNLLLSGKVDIEDMSTKKGNKSNFEQENYLILKYKTNWKEPLRKYYEFTLQFTKFFDIGIMVEEVEDGFLLFHQSKEDFQIGQMDKANVQEIKTWLQNRGIDLQSSGLYEFFTSLSVNSK